MTFSIDDLSDIAGLNKGQAVWSYITTDSMATIVASGYFNPVKDKLKAGDTIIVTGDGVPSALTVATNNGTTVTTAALTAASIVTAADATTGQTASTQLAINNERITVKRAGAVGDGVTDDLAAFVTRLAKNTRVWVPKGHYIWSAVPDLSALTSVDFEGDGADDTIIELAAAASTKSVSTGDLTLLRARGIQFKGFNTVFKITGDLGVVDLDRVKVRSCKALMADDDDDYNGTGTPEDFSIDHFRMVGCDIDGAETGVSCVVQVKSAYVAGNIITNLTHDDDFFGIRLGNDSEADQAIWLLQGKIIITGNIITGMVATATCVMNAIQAIGYSVTISDNSVSTMSGSATDCEAYCVKAHRASIHDNKARNAGMGHGSICVKGRATGMAASVGPVGTFVNVHDNHIWYESDYDTANDHVGIYVETDETWVHHNTVVGSTLYGITWISQAAATPRNVRIEDNDISLGIGRGIQCTGHSDGLFVLRNKIHNWVAEAVTTIFGIIFNDSATTAAVAGRRLRCQDNLIDIRMAAASVGQMTGIACAWSTAVYDDIVIGGGKIVCTHDSDTTRGLDVNCSGTGGFGKVRFTPIDFTCTSPYTSFTDANFTPTELDFQGRVRAQTTSDTTVYPITIAVAANKSVTCEAKSRGIQTSATPAITTVFMERVTNSGFQTAGTMALNTQVSNKTPTAGVTGWSTQVTVTGANFRVGVNGDTSTTIEWQLEWEIWIK